MAKVGLEYVFAGKMGGAENKYTNKTQIGLAIKADVKLNKDSASLDQENAEHDKCNMVTGGTISFETGDLSDAVQVFLLGHVQDEETGVVTGNADDVAPFVGVSSIATKYMDGVYKYKATFLKKVMFSVPDETDETKKTGSINLGTSTIEGAILLDDNRDYREYKTFDTLEEAKTWVDGHFTAAA